VNTGRAIAGLVVAALTMVPAAAAGPVVRVGVLSLLRPQAIEVRPLDPGRLAGAGNNPAEGRFLAAGGSFRLERVQRQLELRLLPSGEASRGTRFRWLPAVPGGRWEIRLEGEFGRVFAGPASFGLERTGAWIRVVVEKPLEEYVAGVVQAEQAQAVSPASLEALAVLARGNAAAWRGRHRRDGFDVCDNTHCMLYFGEELVSEPVRQAVRRTEGRVLVRGNRPVPHPFTACCGGQLLPAGWLWPGSPSEGPAECPWCRESPDFRWRYQADRKPFLAEAAKALGLVEIESLSIQADRGRGPQVAVTGGGRKSAWPVEQFRIRYGRLCGWNRIRSNRFTLAEAGGQVILEGQGFGHCAGLCLAGAVKLADEGRTVEEILGFYFPASRLASLASISSSKPSW